MPGNKEAGESQGGQGKERVRRPSYLDARRYPSFEEAGEAYIESQETLRRDRSNADLSVYRVLVGPTLDAHVVVLGDTPKKKLLEELQRSLGTGEHVELDPDVLEHLMERRRIAEQTGPWVEAHYRPGNPVRLPRRRR
jgi:hypothetical protein